MYCSVLLYYNYLSSSNPASCLTIYVIQRTNNDIIAASEDQQTLICKLESETSESVKGRNRERCSPCWKSLCYDNFRGKNSQTHHWINNSCWWIYSVLIFDTSYEKGGVLIDWSKMISRPGTRQSKRNQNTKSLSNANSPNYNPALRIFPASVCGCCKNLRIWHLENNARLGPASLATNARSY